MTTHERLHSLDAVRGFALLAGVVAARDHVVPAWLCRRAALEPQVPDHPEWPAFHLNQLALSIAGGLG